MSVRHHDRWYYGLALSSSGKTIEAAAAFRAAIRLNPRSIEAYGNLAGLEMRSNNRDEALLLYDVATSLSPGNGHLRANYANALLAFGEIERAITHYRMSVAALPNFPEAYYGLAQALRDFGDIDEARLHYETAMRLNTTHANAMLPFSMIADSASQEQQARMRSAYANAADDSEQRMLLSFAMGKMEDLNQDYEAALAYYGEGNAIRSRQLGYTVEKTRAEFRRIASVLNRSFFAEREDFGNPDNRPLFILGMPRSGTTLVEQILASHSKVTGAGELPHFPAAVSDAFQPADRRGYPEGAAEMTREDIAAIAASYLRKARATIEPGQFHTDKLPGNFLFIGLIRLVFPNARIIHCNRDPRDTGISLYRTFFPSGGHHFSYDLDTIREYMEQYAKLMEHWNGLFGETIIPVNYEMLVRNPETEIRKLLDKVGLEFEPTCLDFHKTRRIVRTASAGDVRKPIFTSSIGTWERYRPFMKDNLLCA